MAIKFKRGGTFELPQITFYKNKAAGEYQSLEDVIITSHIKNGSTLVAQLTPTIIDAATGKFSLKCNESTEDWPAKTLSCDIRFVLKSGFILPSKTFEIEVEKNITTATV